MKQQIRYDVFETNSSSMHSLCVPGNTKYIIPGHVYFKTGHYGWGPGIEYHTGDYLYTALVCLGKDDKIEQLKEILYRHGVTDIELEPDNNNKGDYYIDHAYDLEPFIEEIFQDEEKLLAFLFTPGARVLITNDNEFDEKIRKEMAAAEKNEEVVFNK